MRNLWPVIGISLLLQALCGSASVPIDAKVIDLEERIEDYAPGAYYKVEVTTPGRLAVVIDDIPADMLTRIIIINEANDWLADKQTTNPGEKASVEAKADAPGWYYIGVLDLEGKIHESAFAFHVSLQLQRLQIMADLSCPWTGSWTTNFGDLLLEQDEDIVNGTYTHSDGKITGQVQGQKLVGTWSELPSYNPPDDAGDFEFTMSKDCQSFQGRWRYGSTGGWHTWSGTRN